MKLYLSAFLAASAAAFAPTFHSSSRASTALNTVLDRQTGRSQLDPAVIDRYSALPYPKDKVLAEYVWVDADGNTRSKTRTLPVNKVCLCDRGGMKFYEKDGRRLTFSFLLTVQVGRDLAQVEL